MGLRAGDVTIDSRGVSFRRSGTQCITVYEGESRIVDFTLDIRYIDDETNPPGETMPSEDTESELSARGEPDIPTGRQSETSNCLRRSGEYNDDSNNDETHDSQPCGGNPLGDIMPSDDTESEFSKGVHECVTWEDLRKSSCSCGNPPSHHGMCGSDCGINIRVRHSYTPLFHSRP